MLSALKMCRNTCEGPDGIHYQMIKHLPPSSIAFLLSIYNKIWSEGVFPPAWREAIILPFLKPGKTGSQPQHYTPIALTSCLGKLLERRINTRLMWVLESKSLLSPSQFGFRHSRSTADPLTRLQSSILTTFAQKQHVLTVFFDMEKAYDTSWRYHNILHQLSSWGIKGNLGVFIQSFLSSRVFTVRLARTMSSSFTQHEGVPQGSVLLVSTSLLFLVAINGITSSLPIGVRASVYVDDFAIYTVGSSPLQLQWLLQTAISSTSSWPTDQAWFSLLAPPYK